MRGNLRAEEVNVERVVEISPTNAVELGGRCILELSGPRVAVMGFG